MPRRARHTMMRLTSTQDSLHLSSSRKYVTDATSETSLVGSPLILRQRRIISPLLITQHDYRGLISQYQPHVTSLSERHLDVTHTTGRQVRRRESRTLHHFIRETLENSGANIKRSRRCLRVQKIIHSHEDAARVFSHAIPNVF